MSKLYLIDDNEHSFEYVYATLMKDLKMLPIQAEQCCLIAHNNKRCIIANGDILDIISKQGKLEKRNLKTEIIND